MFIHGVYDVKAGGIHSDPAVSTCKNSLHQPKFVWCSAYTTQMYVAKRSLEHKTMRCYFFICWPSELWCQRKLVTSQYLTLLYSCYSYFLILKILIPTLVTHYTYNYHNFMMTNFKKWYYFFLSQNLSDTFLRFSPFLIVFFFNFWKIFLLSSYKN